MTGANEYVGAMQLLAHTPPKLRWKLYFGLLAALLVFGIPTMPHTAVAISNTIMQVFSLTGLFAYAWCVRVPGSSGFWRSVAVASVVLMLASMIVLLRAPAGERLLYMPVAFVLSLAIISFLTLPVAVALFRYAAWIAGPQVERH